MRRRVVITGVGQISPLACDTQGFWQCLVNGTNGVGPIQGFDAEIFDSRIAGECTDFDPTRWIEAKECKRLDRFSQFAVAAAMQAGEHAGLLGNADSYDPNRMGVVVGSGIGGLIELEQQHVRLIEKGPSKVSAFTIPKLMVNAAAGNISIRFGALGPNSACATACASASTAMGEAYRAVVRGETDVMITGGSEAAVTRLGVSSFCAMKALSTRNDDPAHASRPFDKDRDGFVMGEGAGIVVFEELEHAKRRGAEIHAEVLGFGASGDGYHITAPEPEGKGASLSMQRALEDAGISADQIQYINAHGTSTTLGDIAETKAIKRIFGDHARKLMISSTKSQIGHLLGASGGVELVATVLMLRNRVVTPTINLDNPDDECDLDYVPNTAREVQIDVAMSNSFGFGGHNASLIVRRFTD